MKKIFLLLFLLPVYCFAQDEGLLKENTALRARVDSLEKRIDDKYYTRVPNRDLDKQLNDMVDNQVGDYFSGKLAIISSVIFLLSFLAGYLVKFYSSERTRKQIEDGVKASSDTMKRENAEAQKNLDAQFDAHKTFVSDNNKLYNERLGDISTRIDNLRNGLNNQIQSFSSTLDKRISDFESNVKTQITQLNDQHTVITKDVKNKIEKFETDQQEFIKSSSIMVDNKMAEKLEFIWTDLVNSMLDRATEKNYNGEEMVKGFEKLLKTNINITDALRIHVIDTLMRCYYSTDKLEKKYDKMVKLVQTYENQFDLFPETYVNAAIALTNNYQSYGSDDLRENAIANCDKSIQKNRIYGIAYAIKLQIFLIDLVKKREPVVKQQMTKEIDDLIFLVNSINSPLLKGDFLSRLQQDKKVASLEKYIDHLYKNFPFSLAPLRDNVVTELVKNFDVTIDQEKTLLDELLREGLVTNPDIDGKWKATEYLNAGNLSSMEKVVYLDLKEKDYQFLLDTAVVEKGIVYYYPLITPNVLVLICKTEGESKNTITRGIYKIKEDNSLQLCLAKPGDAAPTEFISDAATGNTLLTFIKEGNNLIV